MSWTLEGDGLSVALPPAWEAQIRPAAPPDLGSTPEGRAAASPPARSVLHAANFALPAQRGDYGSGAVERMGPPHVLLCLLEHDPDDLDQPLFARIGVPTLTGALFSPSQMQRTIPGMAGAQEFFQASGRTFCLYVVVGSYRGRSSLAAEADAMASPIALAKRVLRTSPRGATLVRLLDRVGLHEPAGRLDRARSGDDAVVVSLPDHLGVAGRVKMHRHGGRDQVARALHSGGFEGFEPPLPAVVARVMARSGGVLLDVGANTGLYSLIATAAHPDATAIAFEPVPAILELLRANVVLNEVTGRVVVDDAAVGEETGTATLHLPPPQLDGTIETSASLEPDFKEEIEHTFEVRTSTLDDAWRAHGRPSVSMVKVDVEGAEAKVLRGAPELVSACRPVLSVEVLGRLDSAPLEAVRAGFGYVDVVLGEHEAVVGRAAVTVASDAPNHLLVPPERLDAVIADLRAIPGLAVTVV